MMKILSLRVDDQRSTVRRNEEKVIKTAFANSISGFKKSFDCVTLEKYGAQDFIHMIGEKGVDEVFQSKVNQPHLVNRYHLTDDADVEQLLLSAPLYSAVKVVFEKSCAEVKRVFEVIFVKTSNETHNNLAEFSVYMIKPTFTYTSI